MIGGIEMRGHHADWIRRAASSVLIGAMTFGCASMGNMQVPQDRTTCIVVGGTIGALLGSVIANNAGESETDEELTGAGLGAAAGAGLAYLICGEGREPQPPQARINANPESGTPPLEVAFAGSATDPDGTIVSYAWDFGDGATAQGARVGHTYSEPGSYDVRLQVTDDDDLTGVATARIEVGMAAAEEPEEPAATRRRIVLRGITFGFDSAEIGESDGQILDVAVEQLREAPEVRVSVVGHTDSIGAEAYNQGLSQRRARAVVSYLTSRGIAAERLTAEGKGEAEPLASNDTSDGRAQNRRVALDILE